MTNSPEGHPCQQRVRNRQTYRIVAHKSWVSGCRSQMLGQWVGSLTNVGSVGVAHKGWVSGCRSQMLGPWVSLTNVGSVGVAHKLWTEVIQYCFWFNYNFKETVYRFRKKEQHSFQYINLVIIQITVSCPAHESSSVKGQFYEIFYFCFFHFRSDL